MNTQLTRDFLDTCNAAKRILKWLPPLPDWMTPRQVFIIDAIHQIQEKHRTVRTSDIAKRLDNTMPSITRMISDLEAHDVLVKIPDDGDKRAHCLRLTAYGEKLYAHHVEDFHAELAKLFSEISEEDMKNAINVFNRAEGLLKNYNFSSNEEV